MTILDKLAAHAIERVAEAKKYISAPEICRLAMSMPKGELSFEKALRQPDVSFICECKKASPSKGLIAEDFPYLQIAKDYEAAGADCISVLTEPKWFLGSNEYLREIAANVSIPCLRKDFTVDEYMIYEAKTLGASAVLLIVSILSEAQLREYIKICDELGLSALVEIHDEKEALTAYRRKQPESKGFFGRYREQPQAQKSDTERYPVRVGKRRQNSRRCAVSARNRRRCGIDRRNADEG